MLAKCHRICAIVVGAVSLAWSALSAGAAPLLPDVDLSWKNVSIDGRASATHCLLLDSRGVIWAGTNNGLCIYDGASIHVVEDEKLAGVQIHAMAEYDNSLYLGTNHGLLSLDINTGRMATINDRELKEIRCLLRVDDKLWVGSLYGVFIVDLANDCTIAPTVGLPHKSTYSLLRDSRGIIYAGTFNGMARWDSVKAVFRPLGSNPLVKSNPNLLVNCLLESADGTYLYVGTEGALYKYYVAEGRWEEVDEYHGNNIKSLSMIDNGHLLVGTDNGVFDAYQDSIRHYRHDSRRSNSLDDNEVWCLLTDNDRNVWAGHERGFSISSHSNTIRVVRLSSLAHTGDGNEIHCILRDTHGSLWLGGTNGALQLTDNLDTRWYRHDSAGNSLSHNRIRAIDEDSDGNVWFSTDAGLNRFDHQGDGFDVFHIVDSKGTHTVNWAYALKESADSYWVGGFLGGIHRVDRKKLAGHGGVITSDFSLNADKDSSNRLDNDLVNDIVIDNRGNVWVLLFRDDVLACYDPSADTMTKFKIGEMGGEYPTQISKDSRGRIWCVFSGGAVMFTDPSHHRLIKYAAASADEEALAVAPVGDDMWISTRSNMWKIDGTSLKATILPIPQKAYTAIFEDADSNTVFLGGNDEIYEINLANLSDESGQRNIELVLVSSNASYPQPYDFRSPGREITIDYGGNISLIVSTLDYTPGSVHRYMYKLADNERDTIGGWTILPEGINTISLTDLKMGRYRILVKRVGLTDAPVAIPLHVRPPLLLSWWAIVIYMLIAMGAVYAIVLYFQRKNRRKFQEEERIRELTNIEKKLTFLSDISHDLKTPLSMILGPVSLLKDRAKDGEVKKTLQSVYDNAVKLNNMIHKTIELHQLDDAGDSLLILSTFDVVEFCKDVFETFKENHPNRNFVFHTSCSELFIEADAVKFESVMNNLLSNACKYSDDGSTISCGISRRDNIVEIVVSDDGMGIDDAHQPLVFQRMFRAPSTSKLREGTGLGLYLIKKYLEMMKGNIDLYSKKGQGTSFIISLPISGKTAASVSQSPADDNLDLPKILIVEDNDEIRAFIVQLLAADYTVLTAENGRAGLAIASSFLPDLVIADEMMPIMSGLEMCRRMKQNPRLASTPMIMLTAKSDNHTENESIKLGIDVFMPKPFEPAVLTGRIKHLLKSRDELREKVRISTITEAKPIEAESTVEKQLAKIAKIIEDNISDTELNVNLLCEKCDMPQKQLYRLIKKYMGVSPLDYIRSVRLQKAAMLLGQKRFTVSEISYMVGFKTPSYFAKCFQAQFGVKPSQYESPYEE